jgi:hypothetical protein
MSEAHNARIIIGVALFACLQLAHKLLPAYVY